MVVVALRGEEEGGGGRRKEEEEDAATNIKSNNPHLAGGEKTQIDPMVNVDITMEHHHVLMD